MALIFILSSQPGLRVSDDASVDRPLRALAHLATFGVLGALLFRALAGALASSTQAALLAFAGTVLYAVSDELHQSIVPDRTGRLDDVLVDTLGAAIGIGLAVLVTVLLRRRRSAPDARR
jgi:VanZ family protein